MASVFVKIYVVSQIPWPGPELESPRLQPQTCLPQFLTTTVFSASTTAAVMLRSAAEQRKGGDTLRHSQGNIVTDYGNRNTANITYIYSNYNKKKHRQIKQILDNMS